MKKLLSFIITFVSFSVTISLYAADTCKNDRQVAYFINSTPKPVEFKVVQRHSSGFYTNDAAKTPVEQFTLPGASSANLLFCYNSNSIPADTKLDANNSGNTVVFGVFHIRNSYAWFKIDGNNETRLYLVGKHDIGSDTLVIINTP